jgi:hypothetical protein
MRSSDFQGRCQQSVDGITFRGRHFQIATPYEKVFRYGRPALCLVGKAVPYEVEDGISPIGFELFGLF